MVSDHLGNPKSMLPKVGQIVTAGAGRNSFNSSVLVVTTCIASASASNEIVKAGAGRNPFNSSASSSLE